MALMHIKGFGDHKNTVMKLYKSIFRDSRRERSMKPVSCAILLVCLAGCANSFSKVRNAAASAPEWYADAREEIIGEGYPDLGTMPRLSEEELKVSETSITMSQADVQAAQKLFASSPRANDPTPTSIEMLALKDDLSAKLDASGPVPTGKPADLFLTEEDLNRFRKIFARAERR